MLDSNCWIEPQEDTFAILIRRQCKGATVTVKCDNTEDFNNWVVALENAVKALRSISQENSARTRQARAQLQKQETSSKANGNVREVDMDLEARRTAYGMYVLEEQMKQTHQTSHSVSTIHGHAEQKVKSKETKIRGTVPCAILRPEIIDMVMSNDGSGGADAAAATLDDLHVIFARSLDDCATALQHRNRDSDFTMSYMVRAYFLSLTIEQDRSTEGNAFELIPRDTKAHIEAGFKSWRYWIDDEAFDNGGDKMVFWSENHAAMCLSAEWLVGRLMWGETFMTGLKGEEHAKKAFPRIKKWLELRLAYGFGEFNSPVYFPFTLAPLINLVDFATHPSLRADPEAEWVKEKAMACTDLLMQEFVRGCHRGAFRGAAGRIYDKWKSGLERMDIDQLVRMVCPLGTKGCSDGESYNMASAVSASLFGSSSYQLPPALAALAKNKHEGVHEFKWRCGLPKDILHQMDLDETWLVWGAGGYAAAEFLPRTVRFASANKLTAGLLNNNKKLASCVGCLIGTGACLPGCCLGGCVSCVDGVLKGSLLTDVDVQTFSTPAVALSVCPRLPFAGCKQFQQLPCIALVDQQACVWPFAPSLPQVSCMNGIAIVLYNPKSSVRYPPSPSDY
jgi:hypothetical protein